MKSVAIFMMLIVCATVSSTSFSQQSDRWVDFESQLADWRSELLIWQVFPPHQERLTRRQIEITSELNAIKTCQTDAMGSMVAVEKKLKALGESAEETGIVSQLKSALLETRKTVEGQLALCRLLELNVEEIIENLKELRSAATKRALTHRDKPVWEHLDTFGKQLIDVPARWIQWTKSLPAIISGFIFFFFVYPLIYFVTRQVQTWSDAANRSPKIKLLVDRYLRTLVPCAALLGLSIIVLISDITSLGIVISALAAILLVGPIIRSLVDLWTTDSKVSSGVTYFLGLALVVLVLDRQLDTAILTSTSWVVLRSVAYLSLGTVSVLTCLVSLKLFQGRSAGVSMIMLSLALVFGPILYAVGFFDMGELLLYGVHGTVATIIVGALLFRPMQLLFVALNKEDDASADGLRLQLGFNRGEKVAGLQTAYLIFIAVGLIGMIILMLTAWRIAPSELTGILSVVGEGFSVGTLIIVPINVALSIVGFILVLIIMRWIRKEVADRWLSQTKLDVGAQHAILSITGYILIAIAFIVALSVAGIELQNFAILAGALSVGIGFGLQNIVNNFVSGLILLFERPIRPGDWVVVGSTEGYVKKISIRSTLIQTFDRADVLVPNSELLSNHVKNWTLQDKFGRIIVPVGVAYGSDTQLIKNTLIEIAKDHTMVMANDFRVPPPIVMFMGFGASSLDFELRCFIRQADYMLSVKSDLLFSIDNRFRELDIEIPFPQRVLHIQKEKDIRGEIGST
ncbi:MAG: potassium efflux system protein [Parasphingorhabdus sp.]